MCHTAYKAWLVPSSQNTVSFVITFFCLAHCRPIPCRPVTKSEQIDFFVIQSALAILLLPRSQEHLSQHDHAQTFISLVLETRSLQDKTKLERTTLYQPSLGRIPSPRQPSIAKHFRTFNQFSEAGKHQKHAT